MAVATDDTLSQWFAWCAGSTKCIFGPADGRTPAAIASAYDDLVVKLDEAPAAERPPPGRRRGTVRVPGLLGDPAGG